MDDEKKQKRLENLAKARQRIMELRAEKEKLSVKSKNVEKVVEKVVETDTIVEETPSNVADTPYTKHVVEEEPVKEPVKEPLKEVVKEITEPVKKERKKREYKKVEKSEPIVIENKPVKLSFTKGENGFWYM
ncbi:MAG: hypothetical protein CMJ25_10515 [Phycisphaerae bacterium]|nr:hypothetical protein [Phycisphaerae bacterium]|tara:strand:- start:9305 stop:9700 length:396 start_codon:yes stop_codon:yes gene_type:complete